MAVRRERTGDVAVLVIDHPPVNALGHPVRTGLAAGMHEALQDPGVAAIVIRADGRSFPAGADIAELGRPPLAPLLPDLCDAIEASPKPVIAALHGTALGGGLELALAAHYRVALADARVGLPEVSLGILPGAGGTQRLPRLTGAAAALEMMIGGKPIGAARARDLGLIDAVVPGDLPAAALALARVVLDEGRGPRPTRARAEGLADPGAFHAAVAAARTRHAQDRLPGPRRIVDCVEAALLLPVAQGLAFERAAFDDLVATPEAAGLRHAFLAERRAGRFPEAACVPRPVAHLGVVGAGVMGAGIACAALSAGLTVTLLDRDQGALARGLERIATLMERAVAQGRTTPARRAADWARLDGALDAGGLAGCDLVIEAVFEDWSVKAEVFRALDSVLRPGAVIATTSSFLDLDALAGVTTMPADVIGLHFCNPAHLTRLVEVVVGRATAPAVVATGRALARQLGKVAVRTGVCDGFIGERMFAAYAEAAEFAVEDGAAPADVDAAMRAFGFPLGPFEASDLAGLQRASARRRRLAATRDPALRQAALTDRLCAAGRLGQAAGRGWYDYAPGERAPRPAAEVAAIIAAERRARGIAPRAFAADELRIRCLAALANEGARILGEGVAMRPSDVDAVWLSGYGFPRWEGGPMHWADAFGPAALAETLAACMPEAPAFWAPAPLLAEIAAAGGRFADRNAD